MKKWLIGICVSLAVIAGVATSINSETGINVNINEEKHQALPNQH